MRESGVMRVSKKGFDLDKEVRESSPREVTIALIYE